MDGLSRLVNPPVITDKEVARNRLQELVHVYNLNEHVVSGDGNCQFSALSDQLYGSPDYHHVVRRLAVEQMRSYPNVYGQFVEGDFEVYLDKMAQDRTWGDHVTLKAAADYYGMVLNLLTSYKDAAYIKVEAVEVKSSRELWLSFWAEVRPWAGLTRCR